MKKVLFTAAVAALMMFANAQNTMQEKKTHKKMDKKETMQKGKEHMCTAVCKDGKHIYAHGEKGHVCTEACHKKM